MTLFYDITSTIFSCWMSLFYGYEVKGTENWIEGKAIIAANHSSYFDPPLIAISNKEKFYFLGKKPLFRFPIFSTCLRWLNAIPLNQKEGHGLEKGIELLKSGKKVVMFPEGQRSFDGNLLPFQEGTAVLALKTGAPILPFWIEGSYLAWPRKRLCPRLFGKITCVIGKPIDPSLFSHKPFKDAKKELTLHIKEALLSLRKKEKNGD